MNSVHRLLQPPSEPYRTPNPQRPSSARFLLPSARLLLAGALAIGCVNSFAASITLTNTDPANTSSFNSAGRWSNVAAPSAGNSYFTTNFVLRTPNPTTSGNNYVFGGDSLSIDPGGRFLGKIGNNVGANTTVGTITVNNLILNGGMFDQAGNNGDNSVLIVAGNVTVTARTIIGALGGTVNGSTRFETLEFTAPISGAGALQVSGPNINNGGNSGVVKLSAANPYTGIITVSNANNNIIASAVYRILQLNNRDALAYATLNLDASQANPVSFTTEVNTGSFNIGALTGRSSQTLLDTAGAAVTLTVGANNASTAYAGALTDSGNLVKTGTGTLTLTGTNTYFGTTAINDGSLQLGDGGATGALPTGNTLALNGNLTINRNNTVVQGVDFTSSPITGTGSFTQSGTGTTILNAANSYSGPTTVNAGKLVISTSQTGTGALALADGAKLGVSVSGSSQLSPSTLTLGSTAATTLDFEGVNSTSVAPINTGSLSIGGTVTVNINTGTFAAGNNYPLIHWTGNGPADASAFVLGISPGLTATFSIANSTLYLNVAAVSDIWAGTLDGNWDTTTANWAGNATVFANGHSVLFDDSATGPTTITVAAPVAPASILINNGSLPYTVTSSTGSAIGGTASLTKLNSGTFTLSGGANTYTGPTVINAGVLSISSVANSGQPSDIGAATTDPANLVLNGGTLQYTGATAFTDRGATLAADATVEVTSYGAALNNSGNIIGTGSLTKLGQGTLALSGASTFSGGVNLNAGQLDINNGGTSSENSAIGAGTLTIGADTTIDNTSGSDVTLVSNNPQVWNGSFTYAGTANNLNLGNGSVSLTGTRTVTINGNTLTVGGVISGAAGITKAGAGTLVLLNANTYGNNGAADTSVTGGTLALGHDQALGSSRLNLADGATIQSTDSSARVITNTLNFGSGAAGHNIFAGTGNLKFTASAANGSSKITTVNNPQTEFSGVLSGNMARTVSGTGVLIFSGANTYSQGTTINPGATLQLGNGGGTGSLSASGAIVNDGTLRFNRTNALVQGTHFSTAPITGSGSVVQDGTGVTTLTAANTYTGPTLVNNGTLFITPACQAGGEVIVANGASFGVSANSVTNSALVGNLTLGTGGATTLDFSYALVGNPTNAALVANAVTINGTCAVRIGGSFTTGTFPVLKYNNLSGTFSASVSGPRGVVATLSNDSVNKVISVTVSSVGNGVIWTGTDSVFPNLWDLNTTLNWAIGGSPTTYLENVPPGDAVTFNDTSAGLVLLSNLVSPASITINNTTVGYTFQGTGGQINSAAGLIKSGTGSVTLNVPATFSGSTVVSNGPVSIGANQTWANLSGDSVVSVSTGSPTLTVNNSLDTTFDGSLIGALGFTKTGSGRLALSGSNNFSGNLFVKAGQVVLDSGYIGMSTYASIGQNGQDNATLTLKDNAVIATTHDFNVGDINESVGTLNIQDSASLTVSAFYVGSANGSGSTANGTVNQTGGTVTQLSSTAGLFTVGGRVEATSIGGVGVYNMSGGVMNATTAIRIGGGGTGTFNQNGGTVNCTVDVNLARFSGSSGTYNLNGGSLRTARVTSSSGVNATLNLNGGLLVAREDNTSLINNLSMINVRNGGARIDTAGFNVSIASALQHSTIPDDNAIDGGLTKLGEGTLTLTDSMSAYTGPTVVSAGTLSVSPYSAASLNALTVNSATLRMMVGTGSASVNAASLNLAGTSALNLNYEQVSGVPMPALNLSGSITASGTTTINVFGYGWTPGQYTLVDYTGTALPNLDNFVLGALPYGVTANLFNNTASSSIDLIITGVSSLNWIPLVGGDGFGSSSFNSGLNWQDYNPPVAGNGYSTRAFTVRSPADNQPYTFAGDALAIDQGGQLLLKGTDGQVVTVGNLLMNGGFVVFGVSTSDNFTETLAGAITLQTGTTSIMGANGSANTAETLNVTAPISGGGSLRINGVTGGAGTILLASDNTYTGTTTVAGGTLVVNGANGSSAVTVNSGGTVAGTGTLGALNVLAGGNVTPGIPARGALTPVIGALTAGNTTINGGMTVKIDRAAVPASDKLIAPSVVIAPGATLTVNNLSSTDLAAGDTFTLFSTPVSGAFATINLPALPNANLVWTNRVAFDGTIAVISTASVNPDPTDITSAVVDGKLTLTWPKDHTGWTLQVQDNPLDTGLGNNWVDVPESTATNSVTLQLSTTNGAVFYRLKL